MPKNFKILFDAMPAADRAEVKERVSKTREKMIRQKARPAQEPKRSKASKPKTSSSPQAKC